jgi:hypothetical protein
MFYRYSDCWERQSATSANLGYAWTSKMVRADCPRPHCDSRVTTHVHAFRDAWEKQKDLDSYEAKWLYVDALLKVRKLLYGSRIF